MKTCLYAGRKAQWCLPVNINDNCSQFSVEFTWAGSMAFVQ